MRNLMAFALVLFTGIPTSYLKAAFFTPNASTGNIYYVASTGNDSNQGTLAQPWRTIYKATNMIRTGDLVYIRGGTYQESNTFYPSGTQTAPITIAGYPGEVAIIDGNTYQIPSKNSGNALVQVYGDWYIIQNITLTKSGDQGISVHGSHDTIDNVYSHHNWGWGIVMTGNYDTTQNSQVWSNSMKNENHVMTVGWSGGVTCARYPDYCTVRSTKSWENWGEGISTFESMHTTIDGNTSFDNQQNIYISDTRYALVQGNFSYCTPGNRIDQYELQNGILVGDELGVPIPLGPNGTRNKSSDNIFLNNIVMGCDNNLFATEDQAANNLFAYNTFVNSDMDQPGYAANIQFVSGRAANQRFINNLVYQNNGIAIAEVDAPGIIAFSHNLWSKTPPSSAAGSGDVIGDPKMVMTSSPYLANWYKLSDLSPAINKGNAIAETNLDYFGTVRDSLPDIGALEYAGMTPIFTDVPLTYSKTLNGVNYFLYQYIQALYDEGYTAGCNTNPPQYCPDRTMSRAEGAVFMLRASLGSAYIPPAEPWDTFADDWSLGPWAEKWAEGMWAEGMTAGCQSPPESPTKLFCPWDQLPRVQAAVFGLRMKYGMNYVPPTASGTLFADSTAIPGWGLNWSEEAYLDGLLPACGTQGGRPLFCPGMLVDRAWAAYMIVIAKGLLP